MSPIVMTSRKAPAAFVVLLLCVDYLGTVSCRAIDVFWTPCWATLQISLSYSACAMHCTKTAAYSCANFPTSYVVGPLQCRQHRA